MNPVSTALSALLVASVLCVSTAAQSVLKTLEAPLPPTGNTKIGDVVTPGGDLDGDGVDDFLIGSQWSSTNGFTNNGAARVVSGKTGTLLYYLAGAANDDRMGSDVAGAFDWDGDGHTDFAVGVPKVNGLGEVRIYAGMTGQLLTTLKEPTPDVNSHFGFSFAVADINLDGKVDFVVGVPLSNIAGSNNGAVETFLGKTGTPGWTKAMNEPGQGLGATVRCLGDVMSDGIPDFAVSAPWVYMTWGVVYTLSGQDGSIINSYWGKGPNQYYGMHTDVAGDVDNDGTTDFIVGNAFDSTKGTEAGEATVYSGWTGASIRTLYGAPWTQFGSSVGPAGDVNGDGYADYLVGAENATSPAPMNDKAGGAWLYSGKTGVVMTSQYGPAVNAHAGACVGYIGDIDKDGKPDYAVGSSDYNGGEGYVAVYLGKNDAQQYFITGDAIGSRFGSTVAIVDDIDGDGVPDLLVGSPGEKVNDKLNAGVARVISAKTGAILRTMIGASANERCGASVAAIADINGDGMIDYAVGAPGYDGIGLSNAGAVKVYSGHTGALIRTHIGGANEALGSAVAGVGDVDQDGVPDVAAGAPLATPAGLASGRVMIWSGANGAVIHNWQGSAPNGQFGAALAGVGDLDNDGAADLIVGSPHEFYAQFDAGAIRVLSGKTGAWLFTKSAFQQGGEYGSAVAGGMDVDGDGKPDFLVGAPMLDNSVIYDTGGMYVYSGATFQLIDSHYSNTPGEHFGASLAFLGDINNDGRADYVVGGPDYSGLNAPGAGRAIVFSGIDGSQMYVLTGGAGQRYGSSFGAGGDLDKNQYSDVAIGAPGADDSGPESGLVRLVSLFPKGISLYGTGTPGCAGPVVSFTGSAPTVGNANFSFTASHVPPAILSLGIVGNVQDAGSDPFGIGATLLVNLLLSGEVYTLDVTADASGHGYVKVAIPNNPAFAGKVYFYQAISYWGGICQNGPMGFSSSNGVMLTIQ